MRTPRAYQSTLLLYRCWRIICFMGQQEVNEWKSDFDIPPVQGSQVYRTTSTSPFHKISQIQSRRFLCDRQS
jgi:hypothetical protein